MAGRKQLRFQVTVDVPESQAAKDVRRALYEADWIAPEYWPNPDWVIIGAVPVPDDL